MPGTGKDLTGERFGKLVVIGIAGHGQNNGQRTAVWKCLCDCGKETSIDEENLKNGRALSCGCDRIRSGEEQGHREVPYEEQAEEKRALFRKGDFSQIQTLNDWVCIWLQDVLPNVVKSSTIRMYAETMGHHILGTLGTKRLDEITEQTVKEWVSQLQSTKIPGTKNGCMTEGTARNTLSVLSGCMRDAQKYGLIGSNPCIEAAWTLKSVNVEEHKAWLDKEQVGRLEPYLAAYRDENGYPIGLGFQLVLYTGITLSEAAALRWRNVDLEEEKLSLEYFVAVKREENGEQRYELEKLVGRKKREIPVPGFLMRELRQVRKIYGGEEEDFVLRPSSREPVRIDRMRAALLRKGNSCGMEKVTPRMLRDTYAMRAVYAGATSDMIAELMGFASSQQVIRRYMPRTVTDKRELIKKMFEE